jgi:hypothetical protein
MAEKAEPQTVPHIVVVMCGHTRLSTDYSEIRIKLKFDPEYPYPGVMERAQPIQCWSPFAAKTASVFGSRCAKACLVVDEGPQGRSSAVGLRSRPPWIAELDRGRKFCKILTKSVMGRNKC